MKANKYYCCYNSQKKTGDHISSGDWVLDPEELASKFSNKTKLIVVNTPHNPLGKIFSKVNKCYAFDILK